MSLENQKVQDSLPKGYDVIGDYQDNIEQSLVDNLFDYFGRVYYKNHGYVGNKQELKLRNAYLSKYDSKIFKLINRKLVIYLISALILVLIALAGFLLFYFLVGDNLAAVRVKAAQLAIDSNALITTQQGWLTLFLVCFIVVCVFALIGIIVGGIGILWYLRSNKQYNRIIKKNKMWNKAFYNFANNLTEKGLLNAIQASIPDFVFDKYTPQFDKSIYNIHNRVYSYADIPLDAKRTEFNCLRSGFYRGNAFSLSYSSWEWFREAKVIDESKVANKINVNVRRSLRRFEDSLCVLVVDTFAEPRLNFVLNNPDGKNIRLQNKIFNNVFSLAVNNPDLAYTVFTPYVQHTLSRCKTWSDSSRCIRQVIKEGSKIYVIFDGRKDFFNFNRIVNPKLNYVFNSIEAKTSVLLAKNNKVNEIPQRELLKLGSLDETASLMTEYVLEEMDILFTALEMATCFPMDNIILKKQKSAKTLYDVLEEKRNNVGEKFKTITELERNLDQIDDKVADINLSDRWVPKFKPMVNVGLKHEDNDLEKSLKL